MAYYAPPDGPVGLTCHSASDGVFGFGRVNAGGVGIDLSAANNVVLEFQSAAGAWVSVASNGGGMVWDAATKSWIATLQATAWAGFPAPIVPFRARDVWADGSDNVLAFGVVTLSDR